MSVFMIEDDFRAIGLSMGVREVALGDAWLQFATFDGSARDFFTAHKTDREHWFDAPAGASDVTHAAFYSIDAQMAFHREHGEVELRELMSKMGLAPGQVLKAPKADPAKGENNPYSENFVGTPAQREARISSLIRSQATLAASLARSCNRTIDNKPIMPAGTARRQ